MLLPLYILYISQYILFGREKLRLTLRQRLLLMLGMDITDIPDIMDMDMDTMDIDTDIMDILTMDTLIIWAKERLTPHLSAQVSYSLPEKLWSESHFMK